MRKIKVIGIGAGHPEHSTIQAINAINDTDVLFITDKGADKVAAPGATARLWNVAPLRAPPPDYWNVAPLWATPPDYWNVAPM